MMNLEVYEKDPRTHTLLNQGVAKVTGGQTSAELETLRYELTNFVCDGQYAEGLSRVLSSYLAHLDKPEQPGVWVSGFFGSGKSHLVKMLQYLWTDFEFADGAKARGLPKKLPAGLKDLLKELSTAAKRIGGLHAAAGTLGAGAGESIRLELLGVIFKSVGLPEQFSRASFMIWLRDEGLEDDVRQFVKKAGGDFDKELANLYVSDLIAKAILSARPDFANKPAEVKTSLQKQFPKVSEISIDEMIVKIKQAVGKRGKLPCTIIILDEVQQYIADDVNRSKAVQDLQEQCCSRLGANVMFVGTGQNALSGMPLLQRLQGRFPVTVELQDTDVEQVTREVVLKKKPTAEAGLKKLVDDHSGEIERQLASTKIAFSSRDRSLLVQDYPILPVRRRFWERVLRAGGDNPLPKCPDTAGLVDMANRVGNEQLKAIHENKEQLARQITEWKCHHDLIHQRLPRWKQLVSLLGFAGDLPVAAEVQPDVTAIEHDRTLLNDPDPVPGMVEKLTSALRAALNEAHAKFSTDYESRLTTLTESPTWKQITQPQRHEILGANGIRVMPTIAVGTTEEVLDTLRHTKLSELRAISDALPTRFNNAATTAAKLLEPKAQHISLPGGTIQNEADLQAWLDDVKGRVLAKLEDGPVIL